MSDDLLYMAAVILMPIVPAFLLFRLIPGSKAGARGPFKGLKLKLSGAFAGYFLVMLVAFELVRRVLEPSQVQNWHVAGEVSLEDGTSAQTPVTAVRMRIKPPHSDIEDDTGHFAFVLPIDRHHSSGWDVPHLIISCPGYQTAGVALDPEGRQNADFEDPIQKHLRLDKKQREIDVGRVVLKRVPRS